MKTMTRALFGAVALVGGGCTDLSLAGDEQLSCRESADCPTGLLCATALGRCVDEAVVTEASIAVDGDAVIDVDRVSRVEGFSRAVVTVVFSKAPSTDATAVVDGRLALGCEADAGDEKTWRCAFDARDFPDEVDGAYDIVVLGVDAAGNEARARARVELDTSAPAIASDSVATVYQAVGASFAREVRALGPATRLVVQLSLTEVAAATPTLELVGVDGNDAGFADAPALASLQRDEQRSGGPLQVYSVDGAEGGIADGVYRLRLLAIDDVGNAVPADVGVDVVVDASAPPAAIVEDDDRIVFARVPWGIRGAPEARFSVHGEAGAAEPAATVVVTSGPTLTSSLLGTAVVADDGSFDGTLQVIDVPRVFVHVVDGAANVGEVARVRDVVWTASLGGRLRSDDFSNPHALFTAPAFDSVGLSPNLRTEPQRPGDLVDGADLVTNALPQRREVHTEARGQPARMAGSMGYLPSQKLAVIFGGVARRNGTPVTDTFVQRGERWSAIVDNPPATGPLTHDSRRDELVTVLANGDTWAFNGTVWAQRPTAPLPVTGSGPIAYDHVLQRLVALRGIETWTLGADDVWTRLASDAPIPGARPFDGLNLGLGAVVAFDGLDGQIILYGNDGGGGGAVHALVDDVWTRLGDAPAVALTTAVEDPLSGRVHFVCRSSGSSTIAAMLTWDGAAMQQGPSDPDPRSGCGATWDTENNQILVHGGTNDGLPNVQALPSNVISSLTPGATDGVLISAATPVQMVHNSGGVWHFNPILNRVLLRGAFTGALTSRTTTLWDGDVAVVATTPTISFGPPFFDGLTSRFVDGNFGQTFVGNSWTANTALPFTSPVEAVFAWDETADTGFGFGGFFGGGNSTSTYRLRGNSLTVLSTTTRPPHRSIGTGAGTGGMAWDVSGQRMIMAGGFGPAGSPLSDTWAFEGDDWRQLDDLPLGASGVAQLVFDRARGVMVGFVQGRLFELRGDSWTERFVDVLPRPDALAVYDEFNDDLLFVGGLDFEIVVTTMTRINVGATAAAQIARFDVKAAGAADDAVFTNVSIDVDAGASGAANGTGGGVVGIDGAELLVWGRSSFVSIGSNAAPSTSTAPFTVQMTPGELGGLNDTVFLALRSAPTGPGLAPARLVARRLELTLQYREP